MPLQKPGKKPASPDRLWIRILEKTELLAKIVRPWGGRFAELWISQAAV
jgi:hypothetical protein